MSNRDRATDYVTGVLSAAESAEVERAAARDPDLAREIERVSVELSALLLDAPRSFAAARWLLGWRGAAPLLLAASLGLLLIPATPYEYLSVTLAALIGAVAIRPNNGLAWLLEWAPLRKLGTLSYALYLLHITALGLVRKFLPQFQDSALVVFALGLPLSILFAQGAHLAIERPFLRLRGRFR